MTAASTIIRRPVFSTLGAALVAVAATAALVLLVNAGAQPEQPLMQLERVTIVGKSALAGSQQLAQLPRVVIEGRRSSEDAIQLAKLACSQPVLC